MSVFLTAPSRLIPFSCIFISGAASLVYELIWIRQLSLVFGGTLYAISAVLCAFMTGLALLNSHTKTIQSLVEPFEVTFKKLSLAQIDYYLRQEQPYQCAGSFKSEAFGISLFSKLSGDDPNSLIGLPLIRLISLLEAEGIDVLQPNQ